MADEITTPVASLFASLGLDATPLEAGLANAKVSMSQFVTAIEGLQRGIFQKLEAPFYAAAAAAKIAAESTDTYAGAVNRLKNQTLDYLRVEQSRAELNKALGTQPRELVSLGNVDVVDSAIANADKQRAAIQARSLQAESNSAEKAITAQHREQEASDVAAEKEYTALKKQIAAEARTAQERDLALAETLFRRDMAYNQERLAARKAQITEERYLYRQEDAMQLQEAKASSPTGPGALGFRGTAVELQAIDNLFGIKIPRGLTSVLARLPQVQAAMTAAFSVFAVIGFLEILDQVVNKLVTMTDDWNGFSVVNQKFWDDAATKSGEALISLQRYNIEMRRAHDLSERQGTEGRKELTLEGIAHDREKVIAARDKHIQVLTESRELLRSFGEVPAGEVNQTPAAHLFNSTLGRITPNSEVTGAGTVHQAIENLTKTITDEEKTVLGLTDLLKELGKEEARAKDRATRETRNPKLRDNLHEQPNILPWFMGSRSSEAFAASMLGTPLGTLPLSQGMMNAPRIPQLREGGSRAASIGPGGQGSSVRSGGVTVQVNPTYQINYKFDGIPADVQSFMRDKAEPQLVKDLSSNTRGLMEDVKRALKNAGVAVNG